MRIDAHHHLWRYDRVAFPWIAPGGPLAHDFGADQLVEALGCAKVDGAIAVQARDVEDETRVLLEAARTCPSILGVVGWTDLQTADVEARLDAVADPRLVGLRHIVQDEPDETFLLRPDFVAGVRAALRRGLAYDLLVNPDQLGTVPAFLERVGEGRIVLDHAAKPDIAHRGWRPWADQLRAVAGFPHVFCKVSGLLTEADPAHWRPAEFEPYLAFLLEVFGPGRLVWGSDWPVCLLAGSYRQAFEVVADFVARACPAAEAAIFGANAARLYGLDLAAGRQTTRKGTA